MIDVPQIARTDSQLTAVIHMTVPRSEIRNVMGPGLAEVRAAVAAQGLSPTGPWFTHHLKMDPGVFDFEVGVPVSAEVVPSGRVRPGRLPQATVARRGRSIAGATRDWGTAGASSWPGSPPGGILRRRTSGSATRSARSRAPTRPPGGRSFIGR